MSLGTDTAMQHVGTDGFERHDGGTDGRAGRWVHMDFALGSYGIDMDFALGSYFCFQHVGTDWILLWARMGSDKSKVKV